MIFSLVLFLFFVLVKSRSPDILLREVAPGTYESENLTDLQPLAFGYTISEQDVKFYFRCLSNPSSEIPINLGNASKVKYLGFSSKKDTVFIIHGWKNEFGSPMTEKVSKAILQVKDANVFIVDWSNIAQLLYLIAFSAVADVGKIVSAFIIDMEATNRLNLNRTFLIGHSLGAHVAGFAGKDLGGKLHHIVGLDPAMPLFPKDDPDKRLDVTDAQFVEIIHTDAGFLGFDINLGHVDYYPNGGRAQPGCGLDLAGSCSHGRSYLYYSESVISGGFLSHFCDNYTNFTNGACSLNSTSFMGEYTLDETARGSYYLTTNEESPFAQNK